MITEEDVLAAIQTCLEDKHPTARTCEKLASFYIILDHMRNCQPSQLPQEKPESEVTVLTKDLSRNDLVTLLDNLLEDVRAVCPRLYDSTMARLRSKG